MSRVTERLLQVGIMLFILFYGWQLARDTVVSLVQQSQSIIHLQRELQTCKAGVSK